MEGAGGSALPCYLSGGTGDTGKSRSSQWKNREVKEGQILLPEPVLFW